MTDELKASIAANAWTISICSFISGLIINYISSKFFKYNPLKIVVLLGTFSLAMAFAGNDLVNFVGVPISGFQSYEFWQASGQNADEFMMNSLASDIPAPSILLYLSGLVMVFTLWFSAKAKRVTETEVKLGAQGKVDEKFKPHGLAIKLVNSSNRVKIKLIKNIPRRWNANVNWRFRGLYLNTANPPAFDLVRASVNLMVASVLIAFASSLRLPLSTTYVSFMVAMGSSLADRAWGDGSAPYRVAGVINVIGGWFLTAFGAFFGAAIIAILLFFGGFWLGLALFMVAFGLMVRSNLPRFYRTLRRKKT